MTDPDNSYRPRSPDFSGFQAASASPPGGAAGLPFVDPYSQPSSYPLTHPLTPQASYDASPFFNPDISSSQQPQPPQQQQLQQLHLHQQQQQQQQYLSQHQQQYFPPQSIQSQHQSQQFSSYPPFGGIQHSEMPPQTRSRTGASHNRGQHAQHAPAPPPPPQQKYEEDEPAHQEHSKQISHQAASQPAQQQQQWHSPDQKNDEPATSRAPPHPSGPCQGIEIKTKFPVARIKRIMQADEDVGKVAQVTPVAVSKALELFMITLVTKAAQQAKAKSSKRVTAAHLKEAIVKDEVLDFLADIMSKVPDQPGGGRKHDEDGSDHNEGRRKRSAGGGGGGRRKKSAADENS